MRIRRKGVFMSSSEVIAIVALALVLGMLMMSMAYAMWAAMRADRESGSGPRSGQDNP